MADEEFYLFVNCAFLLLACTNVYWYYGCCSCCKDLDKKKQQALDKQPAIGTILHKGERIAEPNVVAGKFADKADPSMGVIPVPWDNQKAFAEKTEGWELSYIPRDVETFYIPETILELELIIFFHCAYLLRPVDTDQFAEGLLAHCRVEQALWDDVHDSDAPVAAPTSICSMPKHHGRMNGWMGAYNYSIYAALILWRVIVSTGEDDSDFLPRWTEDDWLGPIVYLVLVLVFFFMAVAEFGSAPVAQALSNSMDVTDATQSIEQLHNAAARIEFQADSWRPLKWKEPDAAIGKGVEVFYKRYTHRLKQTYTAMSGLKVENPRFHTDNILGQLPAVLGEKDRVFRLALQNNFCFADQASLDHYLSARSEFKQAASTDQYVDRLEKFHVDHFEEETGEDGDGEANLRRMIVSQGQSGPPWWLNKGWYWLASLLGLNIPYRMLVNYMCYDIELTFMKVIRLNSEEDSIDGVGHTDNDLPAGVASMDSRNTDQSDVPNNVAQADDIAVDVSSDCGAIVHTYGPIVVDDLTPVPSSDQEPTMSAP